MTKAKHDERGWEIPDPKPLSIPSGFKRPETLSEQVQRLIRHGLSDIAASQGFETFEDADDFDVEDEHLDPATPYEAEFDPVLGRDLTAAEFKERADFYMRKYQEAADQAIPAPVPVPNPEPPPVHPTGNPPPDPAQEG